MPNYDKTGELATAETAAKMALLKPGTDEFNMKAMRIMKGGVNVVSGVLWPNNLFSTYIKISSSLIFTRCRQMKRTLSRLRRLTPALPWFLGKSASIE